MPWEGGYHPIADTRALEVPPPQRGARVSPARGQYKQAPRFLIGLDPADKPGLIAKSCSARLARERGPIVQKNIACNTGDVKRKIIFLFGVTGTSDFDHG